MYNGRRMARRAPIVSSGQVMSGRYRLGDEIGRGGMAKVFAAVDQDLDRRVALKVLQPSLAGSETIRRRFLREARTAANLTSDHVVRVFDVGSLEDGQLWIVMERLEGRDLRQRLASGALAVEEAVDVILQACVALAEAHAAGLVHRDLKPSNLFVSASPDGTTRIKVLDFGIAKAMQRDEDPGLTSTSELLGSPRYMSPEQLRASSAVDLRSDVWALGVILYELLAGQAPFPGKSVAELHAGILEHTPSPIDDGVAAELRRVVMRCLEKDADRRFGDVVALSEALAPFGSHRAPGYVSAARGYARASEEVGRITSPELELSEPIESVIDSSPAAAQHSEDEPAADEQTEKLPVGLETDPTWDASAMPSSRGRTGVFVFGGVVVLTLLVLVFVTGGTDAESAGGDASAAPVAAEPTAEPLEPTATVEATVESVETSPPPTATASATSSPVSKPVPRRVPRPTDPMPSLYDKRE